MFKLKNSNIERSFPYNICKCIASFFPNRLYLEILSWLMRREKKDSNFMLNVTPSYYGNVEIIRREWLGVGDTYVMFEGRRVRIFENNNAYLENLYGNYMTPVIWDKDPKTKSGFCNPHRG